VRFAASFPPAAGFGAFTGSDQHGEPATADFWIVHGIVTEDTTQGNCHRLIGGALFD